jgi:predicted DNA-binding transcriptional regulator YafY
MSAPRHQPLVRALWLMRRLEGLKYRPTAEELAQELNVSPRTVARYLNALEEVHVPVPPVRREDLSA